MDPKIQQITDDIARMTSELEALKNTFYLNNFQTSQDFNKYSRFNTRIKVPHYDSLPSTCEQGEIAETSGKLNICSAADVWTIVGTQS